MQTTALPAAGVHRPRTFAVASLLSTVATVVAFLSIILVYVQQRQATRANGEEWFPEGSIEMGPPGMMLMTFILSIFTVEWAVQAARAEDRPHGLLALATTLLFGSAVLNQYWFVFQDTAFEIDASQAQLLFYVANGSFIAILIAAMAFLAATTLRSLIGRFNEEQAHAVRSAAVFWHATVLCFFIVWYVVFVTK